MLMNLSMVYGMVSLVSVVLALCYFGLTKRRENRLLFLFVLVFVVNLGYFALAISTTLEEALLANRIAYFGSVFLPLAMLMVIANVCRLKFSDGIIGVLFVVSLLVFVITATPGYLDWYYKEVSLVFVNGMSSLQKVYGPLHSIYYVYLFGYFAMMTGVVLYSDRKQKSVSHSHAFIILLIVFSNIVIWLAEQLVANDFEFLSVSYIVSELLLLFLYEMLHNYRVLPAEGQVHEEAVCQPVSEVVEELPKPEAIPVEEISVMVSEENCEKDLITPLLEIWPELQQLSAREKDVLRCILEDKKRKEIAEVLCISENTVKTHITRLYGKLEVANRSELLLQIVQRQKNYTG